MKRIWIVIFLLVRSISGSFVSNIAGSRQVFSVLDNVSFVMTRLKEIHVVFVLGIVEVSTCSGAVILIRIVGSRKP